MKKTLTINLNSIVFNIDDDAYEVLNKYLSDVARHFSSDEEKNEIMADIEARIAELFGERLDRNKEVITLEDVHEIIAIMGNPSQFSDDETSDEESASSSKQEKKKKRQRRFYRDPENAILGGVCAGIAAQFNWDVTVVRISVIALTVFTGIFGGGWFFMLAYFLAWIIAPKAVTASQRLEMQGEDVTVENIKAEFENVKNYVESENFKSATRTLGQRMGDIFKWIIKIFVGFIGAILAFAGFIVVIVLFALLVSAIFAPAVLAGFIPAFIFDWILLTPEKSVMLVVALLLVIGCPIFLLIYSLVRLASGHKTKSRTTFWVTLVLWLSGIFMLIGTTAQTAINWKNQNGETWSLYWNNTDYVDQIRDIEAFNAIDISGSFEIEIVDSPNQLLVVSAPEDFMDRITTNVTNETLFISSNGIVLNDPVKINLSAQQLQSIVAKGAVAIESNSTFRSDNLYLFLQGASKADLNVDVEKQLQLEMEGASKVKLEGVSHSLKIKALGASEIDSKDLKADHADVYVAGASSAKLYASESLNADAYGAAKIVCYGKPKSINKTERIGTSISIK